MASLKGKKILIVDDSLFVQEELAQVFGGLGAEIIGYAGDGVEAIEKYQNLQPDLISLDIIMPKMHGIEAYFRLKSLNPSLEILIVSCLASDSKLQNIYENKIPEEIFFSKPLQMEALKKYLEDSLSKVEDPVSLPAPPSL